MSNLSDLFPSSGAQIIDQQTFTASGTWTKPAGVLPTDTVIVDIWGGGGSGGVYYATTDRSTGGGGGGGAHNRLEVLAFELKATEPVTVGAGGASSATNNMGGANGNAGGYSEFKGSRAYGGGLGNSVGAGGNGGGVDSGGTNNSGGIGGSPQTLYPLSNSVSPDFNGTSSQAARWFPGDWGGASVVTANDPRARAKHGGAAAYNSGDRQTRDSVWGGAAGGAYGDGLPGTEAGGISQFGGNGGSVPIPPLATSNVNGVAGDPRGGGGSGAKRGTNTGTTTSGAGGRGEVVITIIRR
ncbi:glycine-rich domain-containing protein [Rhizobium sp. SSA_523]|uniref:glycine-rich domain-containing protein n=1 Tax=Rhizobium sp. SSA_523 TaxID=2952477 RepID=UPI00339D3A0D